MPGARCICASQTLRGQGRLPMSTQPIDGAPTSRARVHPIRNEPSPSTTSRISRSILVRLHVSSSLRRTLEATSGNLPRRFEKRRVYRGIEKPSPNCARRKSENGTRGAGRENRKIDEKVLQNPARILRPAAFLPPRSLLTVETKTSASGQRTKGERGLGELLS